MISESIYCIITKWIWTSIYFTTKQFGAHLIKLYMIDHRVSMPTTGKTFVENGIFTSMMRLNAISGTRKLTSPTIIKVARQVDSVRRHMAGRSFNFIPTFTKQTHANTDQAAQNFIAHFITLLKRREKLTIKDFKSFQKLERHAFRLQHMLEICSHKVKKACKVIIIDF